MDAKANATLIVGALKSTGIKLVATLPDEKMVEVIRAVEHDGELRHVPLCREEEGIGICAGAYLAGVKTALIMQNAGFLNSCNALGPRPRCNFKYRHCCLSIMQAILETAVSRR